MALGVRRLEIPLLGMEMAQIGRIGVISQDGRRAPQYPTQRPAGPPPMIAVSKR